MRIIQVRTCGHPFPSCQFLSPPLSLSDPSSLLSALHGRALATTLTAFSSSFQPRLVSLSSPDPLSLFHTLSLFLLATLSHSLLKAKPTATHPSMVTKQRHEPAKATQKVPIALGPAWRPPNPGDGNACTQVAGPRTHEDRSPSFSEFDGGFWTRSF